MKRVTIEEIKKMLNENKKVIFTFQKKDGSLRIAQGTTVREEITERGYVFSDTPSTRKKPEGIVSFYDLEINEWRSFSEVYNQTVNVYEEGEELPKPEKTGYYLEHTDDELRTLLNAGIVEFKFKKTDGSEREAKGTTRSDLVEPKKDDKIKVGVVEFFDLDKNKWRCAKEGSIIEVKSI